VNNIDDNEIGNKGVIGIGRGLEKNTSLTRLYLGN
jgi:hypothetical protein